MTSFGSTERHRDQGHDSVQIFKLPKVTQQHTYILGVVGKLIRVLLEIYRSLQQRKNFANRSRIDKVIAVVMEGGTVF